jgi:catechol 2,3-dioxygenase-like lactoylglutathione lyase family enzyme
MFADVYQEATSHSPNPVVISVHMRLALSFVLVAWPLLSQVAPPNDAGVAMGHLDIVSSDPEAHRRLWVDVLGGKVAKTGSQEWVVFPGVFVGITKGQPSGGTSGTVISHLGFIVPNLAAVRAKLVAAGVENVRDLAATNQFFATFPDAVQVEFSEDTTLDAPIKHHHVHFSSHQVEEMRAWYAKVFGAVPGMRGRFRGADIPGANLSWSSSKEPRLPTSGRSVDHIGFEVKDIESFCERLKAEGVKLDGEVTSAPRSGLRTASFTDPWGTRVELTEGLAQAQ